MTPGYTLGKNASKFLSGGFTLGNKGMRILASNHTGWEVQIFVGGSWKVCEDGFPTKELADAALKYYRSYGALEYRVYESIK